MTTDALVPDLTVEASHGVTFYVRIVRNGERYGLDNCLVHDEPEPMVEFYDARALNCGPLGQFVSRYYLSTLREHPAGVGLNLQGGEPDWQIDARAFGAVQEWLRTL